LGARPGRSETIWETFQDLQGQHSGVIAALGEGGLPIKEIRISEPGLGTLYRKLGGSFPP
jgi:hypothetical protein